MYICIYVYMYICSCTRTFMLGITCMYTYTVSKIRYISHIFVCLHEILNRLNDPFLEVLPA